MALSVGSLGPVPFTSDLAPDQVRQRLRADYAEHPSADGVTRLEALALAPASVDLSVRLAPLPDADAAPASDRLDTLTALLSSRAVCPLFVGPRYLGDFVVEEVYATRRDAAGRFVDVDLRLLEYDGSTATRSTTAP